MQQHATSKRVYVWHKIISLGWMWSPGRLRTHLSFKSMHLFLKQVAHAQTSCACISRSNKSSWPKSRRGRPSRHTTYSPQLLPGHKNSSQAFTCSQCGIRQHCSASAHIMRTCSAVLCYAMSLWKGGKTLIDVSNFFFPDFLSNV